MDRLGEFGLYSELISLMELTRHILHEGEGPRYLWCGERMGLFDSSYIYQATKHPEYAIGSYLGLHGNLVHLFDICDGPGRRSGEVLLRLGRWACVGDGFRVVGLARAHLTRGVRQTPTT